MRDDQLRTLVEARITRQERIAELAAARTRPAALLNDASALGWDIAPPFLDGIDHVSLTQAAAGTEGHAVQRHHWGRFAGRCFGARMDDGGYLIEQKRIADQGGQLRRHRHQHAHFAG